MSSNKKNQENISPQGKNENEEFRTATGKKVSEIDTPDENELENALAEAVEAEDAAQAETAAQKGELSDQHEAMLSALPVSEATKFTNKYGEFPQAPTGPIGEALTAKQQAELKGLNVPTKQPGWMTGGSKPTPSPASSQTPGSRGISKAQALYEARSAKLDSQKKRAAQTLAAAGKELGKAQQALKDAPKLPIKEESKGLLATVWAFIRALVIALVTPLITFKDKPVTGHTTGSTSKKDVEMQTPPPMYTGPSDLRPPYAPPMYTGPSDLSPPPYMPPAPSAPPFVEEDAPPSYEESTGNRAGR